MTNNIEFEYIETNAVTLRTAVTGPEEGELIVILHGFPDFSYGFKKQMKALAAAGYRVAAPDQRGYNLSDKPKGRKAYVIDELAEDIKGLISYFNRDNAVIIGHDWGGAVGWQLAGAYPETVKAFIAINIPHMGVFPKAFFKIPSQLFRSLYMVFFQLPAVPERLMKKNNYEVMKLMLRKSSRRGTFKEDDIIAYKNAWSQKGALTAMLNWYRALPFSLKYINKDKIGAPVKIIWGVKDQFLSAKLATESLNFTKNGSIRWLSDGTHWVNQEEAEAVNEEILGFLKDIQI